MEFKNCSSDAKTCDEKLECKMQMHKCMSSIRPTGTPPPTADRPEYGRRRHWDPKRRVRTTTNLNISCKFYTTCITCVSSGFFCQCFPWVFRHFVQNARKWRYGKHETCHFVLSKFKFYQGKAKNIIMKWAARLDKSCIVRLIKKWAPKTKNVLVLLLQVIFLSPRGFVKMFVAILRWFPSRDQVLQM